MRERGGGQSFSAGLFCPLKRQYYVFEFLTFVEFWKRHIEKPNEKILHNKWPEKTDAHAKSQ
jgi:hypothetical protein